MSLACAAQGDLLVIGPPRARYDETGQLPLSAPSESTVLLFTAALAEFTIQAQGRIRTAVSSGKIEIREFFSRKNPTSMKLTGYTHTDSAQDAPEPRSAQAGEFCLARAAA